MALNQTKMLPTKGPGLTKTLPLNNRSYEFKLNLDTLNSVL